MKRLIPIALLIAVVLAVVPLAAAGGKPGGGGWKHGHAKFNLVGTLTAVDATAGTVTIMVKAGTRSVKGFRGTDVPMTVPTDARIRLVTADGCVPATLADLTAGVKVKARGRIDRTDPLLPVLTVHALIAKAPVEVEPSPVPVP